MTWQEYFMSQALLCSLKSKDPNTKVGCVIVNDQQRQVALGYNGFVAGINEKELPLSRDRSLPLYEQKYAYIVHAEANAILYAQRSLQGCTLYTTLFPCHECAKMIASVQIKKIYYYSDLYQGSPEDISAKKMLDLAGIHYEQLIFSPETLSTISNFFTHLKV